MRNASDEIEEYLKQLLQENGIIEIKRQDMALRFNVVPSQINYVIKTRFTLPKGYTVESKRGGGGYIRIVKVKFSDLHSFLGKIKRLIGTEISIQDTKGILMYLFEEKIITEREAELMLSVLEEDVIQQDSDRAILLNRMLMCIDMMNGR
ncbi:transcriptional regulator CtsR [Pilibacter termitis]|uniref:Transcriptional regulator CtsR n=2 Tax=Pilibacter termitis TaxID=263852 RepID=A0A1T4QPZ4_9ENTE|nr:transcriptional regulator CtsR [Pilibacter termitis]